MLQNKQMIAIAAGALVVIAVVVIVVLSVRGGSVDINNPAINNNQQGGNAQISPTMAEVPANIVVPELGAQPTSAEIGVPVSVTEAAKGVTAKLRTFNITASANKFSPSEIIANQGDTVHVNFTAGDKEYDMTFPDYGMKQTAKLGETKIFEFQAVNPGKYTYYCEMCGGLNSSTKGYFTIVPTK